VKYTRQLFRLALLGAINHQITHIVVAGSIFSDTRDFCGRCHPRLGQLVTCNLCFGTWVGFLLALAFRPRFVDLDERGLPFRPPSHTRQVVGFFADAFAIALAGRFYTEILAILRNQAAVKDKERQLIEKRVERADTTSGSSVGEPMASGG
jgi:hypothetical protein